MPSALDLAKALNNQAALRSEVGDQTGAVATIDEAVILYRALAETNPAAFNPDVAMALGNLATFRFDVEDRTGALDAIEEATRLYRTLSDVNPAAFTPGLERSTWWWAKLVDPESVDSVWELSGRAVRHPQLRARITAAAARMALPTGRRLGRRSVNRYPPPRKPPPTRPIRH